jgi:hypothetical protein
MVVKVSMGLYNCILDPFSVLNYRPHTNQLGLLCDCVCTHAIHTH